MRLRTRHATWRWVVLGLAVWFAACAPAGDETSAAAASFTVRDSAGIEIVENSPPDSALGAIWSVDTVPLLQIGVREGEEAAQFTRPAQAFRLPDERVAVLEGSTREIRVFDPSGTHLLSFGREGEGPTEFRSVPLIALAPPDTILAWDARALTLHRWSATSGDHLGSSTLRASQFPTVLPINLGAAYWVLSYDGILALRRSFITAEGVVYPDFNSRPQSYDIRAVFDRVDPEAGTIQSYADTLPFQRWYERLQVGFEPQARATFAGGSDRFLASGPRAWQLGEYGEDGALRRIVRAAIPSQPTSEALGTMREGYDGNPPAGYFDAHADSFPAIASGSTFMPLRDGSVWVRRALEEGMVMLGRGRGMFLGGGLPRIYDLIDPLGRWIATIELPVSMGTVLEMDQEYVLVAWRDEFRVPFIRKHRIVRPPA